MNRFYQEVNISKIVHRYQGIVFVGVSFRDWKGITVTSNKQLYKNNYPDPTLESTSISLVCGTKTERSSGWIPVGGPIKGSYVVKNA